MVRYLNFDYFVYTLWYDGAYYTLTLFEIHDLLLFFSTVSIDKKSVLVEQSNKLGTVQ